MKKEWSVTKQRPALSSSKGFSLVEVILTSAIFVLLVTALVGAYLYGQEATMLAGNRARAVFLAEEGLEAVRNIRDADYTNIVDGIFGLDTIGSQYNLSGSQDTGDIFTRQIIISNVDAKRKSVTVNVAWQQNPQRTGNVSLISYLTNWQSAGQVLDCDWSSIYVRDTFNSVKNTHDAVKVQADGRYAYMVYDDIGGDTMDFAIVDAQAIPTLLGNLNLLGSPKNIAISGNFAYIASDANIAEMQIVDISNPSAPVARGVFNADGTADGKGVFAIGTTVYLVRNGGSSQEFYIIDASNPDSPTAVGSANLGINTDSANEVYVSGNFAYVSSISNTQELKIVDISNPSAPIFNIGDSNYSYDILADSNDGIGLAGFDNYVILGNAMGKMYVLETHTSAPYVTFVSMYQGNDQINDLEVGQGGKFMFGASNNNVNEEFEVVDITNISSPIGLGALQNSAPFFGVGFAKDSCAIYAVGGSNATTPELYVIVPGAESIPPSPVLNLATSNPTINSVNLSWTAPGDDVDMGTATTYDIRYSTTLITEANWAMATQVAGEPAPQIAGSVEAMNVFGLNPDTTYYFAIKTSDEVPNISALSNVPNATTLSDADIIPPSPIINLALSDASGKSILLTWTAPGDDADVGTATTYDIRYSTTIITEANWAMATQVAGEPAPQIAGAVQTMRIGGLNWNTTYYFAIKTSDEAPNTSAISNVPNLSTRTQSSYLTINSATARSNAPTDNTRVINITIQNNNTDATENVTVNQMSATWNVNTNQRLNTIRINGVNYWTGTATKGTLVTLSPAFSLSPSTTYSVTYLDYLRNMIGITSNIIRFVMADGSSLNSASFNITQ